MSSDATFPTAYLKAVAAIASSDGVLNVADFNAPDDVVALLGMGTPFSLARTVVVLAFFMLLIGGSIVPAPLGELALIANGFISAGFLLAMAFWRGSTEYA